MKAQLISATEISWDIESPSRRRIAAALTAPSSLRSLVSCLVLMDCRVISFNGSGGLFAATRVNPQRLSPYSQRRRISQDFSQGLSPCLKKSSFSSISKKVISTIPRCSGSSGDKDETSSSVKTPFGYTRKDVILIGVGLTAVGVGLKSGLEYVGVDPLQAGNVVQLVLVLGLTIGWISTYIFRVSNKEMTYAQQLRDYEDKVMQKRLESLTEAEMEALYEQVEEEKRQLGGEQVK